MTVGQRIKFKRKELGLTLLELAEKAKLSKSNLSEIENEKHDPSMLALINLSSVFNCTIDWIVKGKETSKQYKMDYRIIDDINLETEIIAPFCRLDIDARKNVVDFIEFQLSKSKKINQQKMTTDTVDFSIKND